MVLSSILAEAKQKEVAMTHSKEKLHLLFAAISRVETGGEPNPMYAVGSAQEIGPYQITYEYFLDSGIQGTWTQNCLYYDRSEKVMIAYWNRYAKQHTFEEYARLHNGGPHGMYNPQTLEYWEKVLEELNKIKQLELGL